MTTEATTASQILLNKVRALNKAKYELRDEIYQVLNLLPEEDAQRLKQKCDEAIPVAPADYKQR